MALAVPVGQESFSFTNTFKVINMRALIHGGNKIVQVSEADFPVAASLEWVDCPDNCTVGWNYSSGICSAPVVDLGQLMAAKIADLKAACEASCRSGWTSSALGVPYIYDTDKDRDQVTLTALAVAALQQIMLGNAEWTYDVTCTDALSGIKAMRPHTAAQLAQVGTEIQAMIKDYKVRYYGLLSDLETAFSAGDAQAMSAVVW